MVFVALAAWAGAGCAQGTPGSGAPTGRTAPCVVARVVDGDTIRCRSPEGHARVRLTGIDTPELDQKPHGPRAAEALAQLVSVNDTVLLEFDVQPRDRHGRTLAYVWRGGVMLNLAMVQGGYALPYTVPPNVRYEARFRSAQREAREAMAGLWGDNGFACPPEQFRRGQCGK